MAIMTRIKNIFKVNINSILDGAEDPVQVLDIVAEDMGKEIAKAKKKVSAAIAQQILIKNDLAEANTAVTEWKKKADTALDSNREDLAREALKAKSTAEERATFLKPRSEHFENESTRLKEELRLMEERYEEFRAKKDTMVARAKVARARSSLTVPASPSLADTDSHAALGHAKDRIRQMEATVEAEREVADATHSTSHKYDELERMHKESSIDEELAALKAKRAK